jgi:hypothetical protein
MTQWMLVEKNDSCKKKELAETNKKFATGGKLAATRKKLSLEEEQINWWLIASLMAS